MEKLKIGIVGFGNLGKAVLDMSQKFDVDVECVFTRRNPNTISCKTKVDSINNIEKYKGQIDVMLLCLGSKNDIEKYAADVAKHFCTVDSFDTHAKILQHKTKMQEVCLQNKTTSIISTGWDPGLFSLQRLLMTAYLKAQPLTFWGKGISQGHGDAIRQIDGVVDGVQYTVPKEEDIELAKQGRYSYKETSKSHIRECFVVCKKEDEEIIKQKIVSMPYYFADYETVVHFISQEELNLNHKTLPHGGVVVANNNLCDQNLKMEFSLKTTSNPHLTAAIMLCYAKAARKMFNKKMFGCKTVFSVEPQLLVDQTEDELLATLMWNLKIFIN